MANFTDEEHALGTGFFFGHFMRYSNCYINPVVDAEGNYTPKAYIHFADVNRPGSRFLIEVLEADLTEAEERDR